MTGTPSSTPQESGVGPVSGTPSALPRLLFVDDEKQVLDSLRRVFRTAPYETRFAGGGKEGLDILANEDFDVIISDMRMPEMDGAEFLTAAAAFKPACKRVLLTGYADMASTIKAINKGKIQAYLEKPIDTEQLKSKIEQLVKDKQQDEKVVRAAREISRLNKGLKDRLLGLEEDVRFAHQELEQTASFLNLAMDEAQESFQTTIKVLSLLVDKRIGTHNAVTQKVVSDVVAMAEAMNLGSVLRDELKNAALLHNLGKICFSDELLSASYKSLSAYQRQIYDEYPLNAREILAPIKGMDYVSKVIYHQNEHFDGSGKPDGLREGDIPLPSRMLKIVSDFHVLRTEDAGMKDDALYAHFVRESGKTYDPRLVEVLLQIKHDNPDETSDGLMVTASELTEGMINDKDLLTVNGLLLLAKGTKFDKNIIRRLREYESHHGLNLYLGVIRPTTVQL